jgi:DNA gyrase subunit A
MANDKDLFSDEHSHEELENSQPNAEASSEETTETPQSNDTETTKSHVTGEVVSLEDRIEVRVLEEEMQRNYLTYAMSVIVSRALPDVRDGLKPVHRRILYTMHKLGLTPGAKYVKSARVVGEVLGKYHPHGDLSVYNALARLAQDFSIRQPLIDGQGNFGSIDGDSPAAMRYTECRLDKPSVSILQDIEKETVDFVDNYDGSFKEPKVLPTIFPNLLVNGQTGIAVGMATEIPPHNLGEVCQALLHLQNNPEATIEELTEYVKGPDLPVGGIIYGKQDMLKAYQTGRGRCLVQSKAECTEDRIIVTEIPYQVNKADLLIKIATMVKDKRVQGIKDIRDETNKQGIRIVIDVKREATPEVVLNQLFQLTDLQTYIHFNMLALVNDGRQPQLLNLKQILVEFLNHRDDVVTRRTQFELNKAEAELHILDGLKIALDFIDEVIALIRASYDKEEASKKLQERFKLSERQAEAILQMRLQTLTNLDKSKIEKEREEKIALIAELKNILENPEVKKALIAQEITDLSDKLKSPRRTQIVEYSLSDYNKEDFIEEEEVLVQLTKSQYMKVVPLSTFRTQGRGGRGVVSFNPKDEDYVVSSFIANSHDYVYAFTSYGRVFRTRVFDLPSGSRQGRGQSLVNYLALQDGEKVQTLLALTKEQEANQSGSLIFATEQGLVKRTKLDLFANIRKTGIIAIGLNEGDTLLGVKLSLNPADKIIMSANNGKTVIFAREALNSLGRTARGVKGIKLKGDDRLISLEVSDQDIADSADDDKQTALVEASEDYPSLLVITEHGFGKQTKLAEFRQTNRAAGGVKTLNMASKTGRPCLVQILYGNEENLIITTKKGITIRIDPKTISRLGRNTQGVKVIKLEKKDEVMSGSVY